MRKERAGTCGRLGAPDRHRRLTGEQTHQLPQGSQARVRVRSMGHRQARQSRRGVYGGAVWQGCRRQMGRFHCLSQLSRPVFAPQFFYRSGIERARGTAQVAANLLRGLYKYPTRRRQRISLTVDALPIGVLSDCTADSSVTTHLGDAVAAVSAQVRMVDGA